MCEGIGDVKLLLGGILAKEGGGEVAMKVLAPESTRD